MQFPEQEFDAYAQLIVDLIQVQQNDLVLINAEFPHELLVASLMKYSYLQGAKFVQVMIGGEKLEGIRAEYSREQFLEYFPKSTVELVREYNDNRACVISIRSPESSSLNANISEDTLEKVHKTRRKALHFFQQSVISDRFSWIVVSFPTMGWAEHVFPNMNPAQGVYKLWDVMKPILRLDSENPIQEWKKHQDTIINRRAYLNKKKYKELHFVSESTDLFVSLHEHSTWLGAAHTSKNGKYFQANLPTEELYTSPDCRFTHGQVRINRPLPIFGKKVEGITMRFEQGKVVEAHAEVNDKSLQYFLNAHERNRYIGEIALVDISSPIFQSGLIFNNILFDENAGIHFALGSAYPAGYGIDSQEIPSEKDLVAMGCNASMFHIDFTMGDETMSVYGITHDENTEVIMDKGTFVKEIDS